MKALIANLKDYDFPSLGRKMQNQAAVEALYSATFVEDYLDYVENVPDDIQRIHTRLRELDMRQHQVRDQSLSGYPHH